MNTEILKVLNISIISAVMVLIALAVMWAMIVLIVRVTRVQKKPLGTKKNLRDEKASDLDSKQMAVAAAFAVAIALLNTSFTSSRQKDVDTLSPWQITHRNQGK